MPIIYSDFILFFVAALILSYINWYLIFGFSQVMFLSFSSSSTLKFSTDILLRDHDTKSLKIYPQTFQMNQNGRKVGIY